MRYLLNPSFLKTCKILYRSIHLDFSPNWKISKKIWDRYRKLPIANCKVQATYIWIDGTGENLRCKTKTMDITPTTPKDCPNWDFDGSATYLAEACSSDVILSPVAVYNDPITQGNNKLVLCETYTAEGKPTKSNHRLKCMESLNKVCSKEPMFGFEQEFMFTDVDRRPFGWPKMLGEPSPYVSHYCSIGAEKAYAREIMECVYRCLLYCGIEVSGCNAEVTPSQWQFSTGPTTGIRAADDLWVLRYLLKRVAEDFGVGVSFRCKPFPNWTASGCHTNFSTKEMREDGGYKFIEEAMKKLEKTHAEFIKALEPQECQDQILEREVTTLAGGSDKFTFGIGDRTASIRISKMVAGQKKGHFQDRRPPAHVDPYRVMDTLVSSLCLN